MLTSQAAPAPPLEEVDPPEELDEVDPLEELEEVDPLDEDVDPLDDDVDPLDEGVDPPESCFVPESWGGLEGGGSFAPSLWSGGCVPFCSCACSSSGSVAAVAHAATRATSERAIGATRAE